ncbi:MAG: family 16 glycoside hydrolase [Pseudomonadota bacterium]
MFTAKYCIPRAINHNTEPRPVGADRRKGRPSWSTGARWTVLEIGARGELLSVTCNGQKTVDGARDATRREGPITLRCGGGTVRVRRVEIRVL